MKDWAKWFYLSKAWRKTRLAVIKRDHGICVDCGNPGAIVHHKIHLTKENIYNEDISLNMDNLEYLCRSCHKLKHPESLVIDSNLMFDENGDIIERKQNDDTLYS